MLKTAHKTSTARRAISLFAAACLLTLGVPTQGFAAKPNQTASLESFLKHFPSDLGTVSYVSPSLTESKGGAFVFHIEDPHANPAAQKKIQEILILIQNKFPHLKVFVEGAAGKIHPEYLDLLKDYSEVNSQMIDSLAMDGEITGVELFALENYRQGKPVNVTGIENADLYRSALKSYRELLASKPDIRTGLQDIRQRFEWILSRNVHEALRRFIKERARWKEVRFEGLAFMNPQLGAYTDFMVSHAEKNLNIRLVDPAEQLRFPHIARYLALESAQQDMTSGKVAYEWREMLKAVRKQASTEWEKGVLQALDLFARKHSITDGMDLRASLSAQSSASSVSARKLFEKLYALCNDKSIDLHSFPNFLNSFRMYVFAAEFSREDFFAEMARLENAIMQSMAANDAEKDFLVRLQDFELLEKTLELKLNREEAVSSFARMQAMQILISEASAKNRTALTAYLQKAREFYNTAPSREYAFVQTLLSHDAEPSVIAMVTGGYHAKGIGALLDANDIAYSRISPKNVDPLQNRYEDLMMEEGVPLSPYYRNGHPFPSRREALLFKTLLDLGAAGLYRESKIERDKIPAVLQKAVDEHPLLSESLATRLAGENAVPGVQFIAKNNPELSYASRSGLAYPVLTSETYLGDMNTLRQWDTLIFEALGDGFAHRLESAEGEQQIGDLKIKSGFLPSEMMKKGKSLLNSNESDSVLPDEIIHFVRQNMAELKKKPEETYLKRVQKKTAELNMILKSIEVYRGAVRFEDLLKYMNTKPGEVLQNAGAPDYAGFLSKYRTQYPDIEKRIFMETFGMVPKQILSAASVQDRSLSRFSIWLQIFHQYALLMANETAGKSEPVIRMAEAVSSPSDPLKELLQTDLPTDELLKRLQKQEKSASIPQKSWKSMTTATLDGLYALFSIEHAGQYPKAVIDALETSFVNQVSPAGKFMEADRDQRVLSQNAIPVHLVIIEPETPAFDVYKKLLLIGLKNPISKVDIVISAQHAEAQKMEEEFRAEAKRVGLLGAAISVNGAGERGIQEALRLSADPKFRDHQTAIIANQERLESLPHVKGVTRVSWGKMERVDAIIALLSLSDTLQVHTSEEDALELKDILEDRQISMDELRKIRAAIELIWQ